MRTPLLIALLVSTFLMTSCDNPKPNHISASNPHFVYEGRIDFSNTASPQIIWQATTIAIDFEGDNLDLNFSNLQGQVFFDLKIDNETTILKAQNGTIPSPLPLSKGRHNLTLTKRSEADAGTIHFNGITAQATFTLRSNPEQTQHVEGLKYLFYGDSLTAGACNEDGVEDQWDDRSTHNGNLSFPALTANAMGATHRNISVSGMGISVGYTEHAFPEIWNRYEPKPRSPIANVASYQPDIVFIYLGSNDDSFSKEEGNPFPSDYSSRHITMVRQMRAMYPKSKFVIIGSEDNPNPRLMVPWQKVVDTLEAEDPNLTHFAFKHGSELHPRVSDHRIMAAELIAWLQQQ